MLLPGRKDKPLGGAAVLSLPRGRATALDGALLRYLFAWLPVALLTLKIKYSIVSLLAVRVISRSVGRVPDEALGLLEKLSLYSNDVWVAFLFVPLVWLVLLRFIPPRVRPWLAAGGNLLLFLLLFATWQCFIQTGRYYSLATLRDSLWWTWHHPEFVGQYLPASAVVQLAAAGIGICVLSAWARIRELRSTGPVGARGSNLLAGYALVVVLCALVPFLTATIPATTYHASVLGSAANAMFERGADGLPLGEFSGLAPEKLIERYRLLTRAPERGRDDRFFGRARGYNVLLFILETAPARVLPVAGDLDDLPNLKALRRNAFVAAEHHSTYPYTDRAWFSILSSLYPSSLMRPASEMPGMRFPGMMHALAGRGYATKVYYTPFQHDETMYRSLGVEAQYLQQRAAAAGAGSDEVSLKLATDEATMSEVRKDLAHWAQEQRNFCIAVGPQIGHAPWPKLPGSTGSDLQARGRGVLRVQDAWLGELAQLLRQQGVLDRTLIVVVGDHGIRIRQEDPSFEGGMIDEYSFHVPLLIAAPGVLQGRRDIPWLTSHIDISPTILDLLGIEENRKIEQGSPIWDPRLADRVTFFFANHYLGADGYVDRGRYFMKNHVAKAVYAEDRLHFGRGSMVPLDSAEHAAVADRIRRMVALQEVLARAVGETGAKSEPGMQPTKPGPGLTFLMHRLPDAVAAPA